MQTKLSHLEFKSLISCLEKSKQISWDDFGVRDPAILTDFSGSTVYENNNVIMYYTGSTEGGKNQASGRAISTDNGQTWIKNPIKPILERNLGGWDSNMATTPWVMKDKDGKYLMYYRGGDDLYNDAIGLAISNDGIKFTRHGNKPIITRYHFRDLPNPDEGRNLMGVIHVCRTFEGKYLVSFEGFAKSCNNQTQIFSAISDDGVNFKAVNNGFPIFTYKDVSSWRVTKVANPRIVALNNEKLYVLTFNGANEDGYYCIGTAFSKDLVNWVEYPNNPILIPTGYPINNPFSGRLEGGVFLKEDLSKKSPSGKFFFMSIPREGPSHKNSVIGYSEFKYNDRTEGAMKKFIVGNTNDLIVVNDEEVIMNSTKKKNVPTQLHLKISFSELSKNDISFLMTSSGKHTKHEIQFNNSPSYFDTTNSLRYQFRKNSFYMFNSKKFTSLKFISSFSKSLFRLFASILVWDKKRKYTNPTRIDISENKIQLNNESYSINKYNLTNSNNLYISISILAGKITLNKNRILD